jgi:hypothetical protein
VLSIYERDDPSRQRLEIFVQRAFAARHAATVRSFMPTLLALEGRAGRICGVAGFRNAASEPLFLEHYLREPIEAVLSDRLGETVLREQVVEIGNLSSASCRAAFHLVAMLPRLLLDRGNQWVVFTATSAVRGILEHFNAPVIELGGARRECVDGLVDDWGRYYETDPRVMAGYLPDGLALNFARTSST